MSPLTASTSRRTLLGAPWERYSFRSHSKTSVCAVSKFLKKSTASSWPECSASSPTINSCWLAWRIESNDFKSFCSFCYWSFYWKWFFKGDTFISLHWNFTFPLKFQILISKQSTLNISFSITWLLSLIDTVQVSFSSHCQFFIEDAVM